MLEMVKLLGLMAKYPLSSHLSLGLQLSLVTLDLDLVSIMDS